MGAVDKLPIRFLIQTLLVAGLACLLITVFSEQAYSQSRQCRLLNSELKSLSSLSQKSSKSAHFGVLYKRQLKALQYAKRDAVALRCLNRSGTRRADGAASCKGLLSKIGKMESNLSKLENKQKSASHTDQRQERQIKRRQRIIRAKLQNLGCDGRPTITTATAFKKTQVPTIRKRKRRGFLSRLLRQDTKQGRYGNRDVIIEPERPAERSYGNVFRTLCVRINDGYYYPVSFATVRSAFDTDDAICQAGNKDTEVRLYVYRNPSETIEDMRDLSGQLYIDLPNAFRYRNEFVKENFKAVKPKSFTVIAGKDYKILPNSRTSHNRNNKDISPRAPTQKPDFYSDPDTIMAKRGGFELKPVREQDLKKVVAQKAPTLYNPESIKQAGIRVIGPTFLGDQQSAKLLLAPDQIQLQ